MLAFAVGIMGISREDFDWMIPVEYLELLKVWQEQQEEKEKQLYELERFNVWLQHGRQGSRPEDICAFPWEGQVATGKVISYGKTDSISKTKSPA